MAAPPPPPPPPIIDDNSSVPNVSNGPTVTQTQDSANGTATTSTSDGTKPWERAWSVDEMRKGASTWSLASDAGLLLYLQEFSQNMVSQTHKMEQKVDGLVHETKGISAKVQNTFNDFLMLSNTQFIENRVYDEEETKDEETKDDETNSQEKEKTREELESEVIPKINQAIASGVSVLENAFVTVEIMPEQVSDEEDEGNLPENLRPEPILELTDVYGHRKLPCFIGSQEFQQDDLVGLAESSSEDEEGSDNEASMKSDEQKSSDDEDSSESEDETVGSSSKSEESSTATESDRSEESEGSEGEKEVVAKKKPRKEKVETVSDDDLFAAGGKDKTPPSTEDDDSDEAEEETNEQPRKSGAPLDFSAELAAKIGAKIRKPDDSDRDQDNDDIDDQDSLEESGKHDSEQLKDDLFSASVDTTSSVRSKGSKKKEKSKHKKSKSRSSSHASQASSASSAVGVAASTPGTEQEWEKSGKHEDDEQDDLFTSSIDTTSSVVSKTNRDSRHRHKHKKKNARSDSQLSNASEKSNKEAKKSPNKSDTNLFGTSPEADLFDEDLSSPFGKKGGMFSGGSGLFDDVDEDQEESQSLKSERLDKNPPESSQDHDGNDGDTEAVKQKPRRSSSGKKLPAGAVAIFGDQGLFGHMPVHAGENIAHKTSAPAKKSEKEKPAGGGLFSDDGDDMFTSSQSSSVVSSKPSVTAKASKTVDLFGDDNDDEEDDDSLFGEKPPKKVEPKSQPSKKKLPAGAVSIFGASPPPLFSTSPDDDKPTESVISTTSSATTGVKSAPARSGSGLFEEDDKTNSFSSETSSPNVPSVPSVSVKPKRKTNQISLFDDQEDEEDGDDLFASIAPSKGVSIEKNNKPNQPKEEKKTVPSKPPPKRTTISLFDDVDDEEDDDDSDIFSTKPPTSMSKGKDESADKKPSVKQTTSAGGLFGAEEDDLFSEPKRKEADVDPLSTNKKESTDDRPGVKPPKQGIAKIVLDEDDLFAEPQPNASSSDSLSGKKDTAVRESAKTTKTESATIDSDKEDDLFAESKQKPPSSDPPLADSTIQVKEDTKEAAKDFPDGEGNDEIDVGTTKSNISSKTTKKIPGAVSLFGGVDIFAGQKPGKAKSRQQVGGLFGDDEDDLFAATSPPKAAPTVAPRTKPAKKEPVETPVTTSSSVPRQKIPVQPVLPIPTVSSAGRDTAVGKLQKTLAFNPAAMLPGAIRPPRKQENVSEATFDKPPSMKTLESTGRDRARIRAKRRPPTRQARRTAAGESMDDNSLFGTDISSTASLLTSDETDGKSTQLPSDSDDLFSSNSYQEAEQSVQRNDAPKGAQAKTAKSDPLLDSFESTATNSSIFFEDSNAGRSSDIKSIVDTNKPKDNLSETDRQKPESRPLNDSLFDVKSEDDLFSVSTEINKRSSQNVKVVQDDDDDEDDLFKSDNRPLFSPPPLDFDSEASMSSDFTQNRKPKTSNDELFSKDSSLDKDIFATQPSTSNVDETNTKKEQENEKSIDDITTSKENLKESSTKKTDVVDDLFGDTGSIFDDIPKRPKEKKKKKATTSKENNIFDETQNATAGEDISSVKTAKKTKGKKKAEKKGKSKTSIFDEDSPSIFDDPLNATSK